VTVHYGAYRNILAVDNFGSIETIKNNIVLTREVCNLSFLCRGEFVLDLSVLFNFVSLFVFLTLQLIGVAISQPVSGL
jgi:hypothetical protein